MFYWEMVALDHVEVRHFAEAGFYLTPSSRMVFTTVNTHEEVICFLIVTSTPYTPRGFVLQIFDGANFLVAKKHQGDAAECSLGANFHFGVRFSFYLNSALQEERSCGIYVPGPATPSLTTEIFAWHFWGLDCIFGHPLFFFHELAERQQLSS